MGRRSKDDPNKLNNEESFQNGQGNVQFHEINGASAIDPSNELDQTNMNNPNPLNSSVHNHFIQFYNNNLNQNQNFNQSSMGNSMPVIGNFNNEQYAQYINGMHSFMKQDLSQSNMLIQPYNPQFNSYMSQMIAQFSHQTSQQLNSQSIPHANMIPSPIPQLDTMRHTNRAPSNTQNQNWLYNDQKQQNQIESDQLITPTETPSQASTPSSNVSRSSSYKRSYSNRHGSNLSISSGLNSIKLGNPVVQKSKSEESGSLLDRAKQSIEDKISVEQIAIDLQITLRDDSKDSGSSSHAKDKLKTIFALRCLLDIGESSPPSAIKASDLATPRASVYSAYLMLCSQAKVHAFGQSALGKLVRIAFPYLTTKRLGTRGNSKYHYIGLKLNDRIKSPLKNYLSEQNSQSPDNVKSNTERQEENEDSPESKTNNGEDCSLNEIISNMEKVLKSTIIPDTFFPPKIDLSFQNYSDMTDKSILEIIERCMFQDSIENYSTTLNCINPSGDVKLDLFFYIDTLKILLPLTLYGWRNDNLQKFILRLNDGSVNLFNSQERANLSRLFGTALHRIIKSCEVGSELISILNDTTKRRKMAQELSSTDLMFIINSEIDRVEEKKVIEEFFSIAIVKFLKESNNKTDTLSASALLQNLFISREGDVKVLNGLINVIIVLIEQMNKVPVKLINLYIQSITTGILRDIQLQGGSSFGDWWVLKWFIDEWLGFVSELYGFKELGNKMK